MKVPSLLPIVLILLFVGASVMLSGVAHLVKDQEQQGSTEL